MNILTEILRSPWLYGAFLAGFGFMPPILIRVFVLIYPRGHERRRELPAEMMAVPYKERPVWLADQLGLALTEGLRERLHWPPVVAVFVDWRRVGIQFVMAIGNAGLGIALLSKYGIVGAGLMLGTASILLISILVSVWRGVRLGGRRDQLVALLLTVMDPAYHLTVAEPTDTRAKNPPDRWIGDP